MPRAQEYCEMGKGHKGHCNANGYRERRRRYSEDNREAISARGRRWREDNREANLEHKRRYYEDNHEAELERRRRWREDNPEIVQAVYWRYNHSAAGMLRNVRSNAKQRGNR